MTSKQKIRKGQFGFQLLEEIFKVQRLMSSGCLDPDFHHKPAGATAKPRNQEIKNHSLVVTFLILKFSDCTMDVVLAFKRLFFYNPSPKTDQTGHTGPAEASMFP